MKRSMLKIFTALIAVGMLNCNAPTPIVDQGPGSETVAIRGTIVMADGSPVPNALVHVFPANYDPIGDSALSASYLDTTDENGHYDFTNLTNGNYNVQAIQPQNGLRMLRCKVSVDSADTAIADVDTLQIPGAIKVDLPDSVNYLTGYVFVPGTDRAVLLTESTGFVLLDSVPTGEIPAVAYAETGGSVSRNIRYNITVASGDTVTVANSNWLFTRQIFLNTTASGANIAGPVRDFPVLIRLSSTNFDFSQAIGTGEDIRFTKDNNTLLPCEIERWDSAHAQAEVWVRLDTVKGNSASQSIRMYWGNGSANTLPSSGVVFDTSLGFQGVWHLNQAQGQTVLDATQNHYNGTPSDTAPGSVTGIIGPSMRFDGVSNCIRLANTAASKLNFPESGRYTVSAWVYMEPLVDTMTQVIVSKGNEDYFLKMYFGPAGDGPRWEFGVFEEASGHLINRQPPITVSAWKQLIGVRDSAQQFLYIDGVLVNDISGSGIKQDTTEHRNEAEDVYIGRFPSFVSRNFQSFCYWNGMIDEVQISNVARDADFIKLSYMNQRPDGRLIEFK